MNQFEKNTLFANRYQLIEKLGIGGYSEVWKAEDNFANKMQVAIKIFAPDKGLDKSGLELFGKEYTLVFNLNHPNLLKPMHYDVFKDSPYLVLQYCSKGSLYQKIGKLSETEIAVFINQAASALAYLHGQETPIIHQDIKPDNFLIDNNGNYLLADFGISSKIRRTLTRSMGEKASTGTMAYMPPEKFSRERQTIKAGDIFSLGVCIYELLTGELPFGEHGGIAILSGAEIPDLPKAFSPQLNELIRSCLAKDPWDRPTAEILMEIAENYKRTGKWNLDKLPIAKEQVGEKQPENTNEPEIRETVQMPVNGHKDEKKKSFLDTFVKYILIFGLLLVIALFSLYYIDKKEPVIEDNVLIETLIQDSLSQVEQQRINDSISAAELAYYDSIEFAEKQIKKLQIGIIYAGGIIFYLDKTGQHGKVCASFDQGKDVNWYEANRICRNLILNGYNDWYLPSKVDFDKMFLSLQKNNYVSFKDIPYWTSLKFDKDGVAWVQYLVPGIAEIDGNNGFLNDMEDGKFNVRAIRNF